MCPEVFLHPLPSYRHRILIALYENDTLADCSAAPALYCGNRFYGPCRDTQPHATACLDRLMARPSYARALQEAKPFMHLLPN